MDLDSLRARLKAEGKLALSIRVIPKSQHTQWAGEMGDGALKVKLAAVPEKGKANDELIRFLAEEFGLRRAQVEIVAGQSNPRKQIRLTR
ncbi:MAG TPA: DUF167 domain-containing protein [Paludibaculum sp.]|jgi:hypothetical protein